MVGGDLLMRSICATLAALTFVPCVALAEPSDHHVPVIINAVTSLTSPLTAGPVNTSSATNRPTSWAITGVSGDGALTRDFSISSRGAVSTTSSAASDITSAGTVAITVTATNHIGTSSPGTDTVVVSAPAVPVISNASPSLTLQVTSGEAVNTMTATNSPTSSAITGCSSSCTGYFAISNSGAVTSTGASDIAAATYTLTLTAANGSVTSSPGTDTITVSKPAVITNNSASLTLPLTSGGPVNTMGATNSPSSWAITAISGDGASTSDFAISSGGAVTTTSSADSDITAAGTVTVSVTANNGGGTSSPGTDTITINPTPSGYAIGTNSTALTYYNNQALYDDVFLAVAGNNGPWDAPGGNAAATLDSTGAPTVEAYTYLTTVYSSATYTLTWQGAGTVTFSSCTQGSTKRVGRNASASVTCTQQAANNINSEGYFRIHAAPPVTNIHMLHPQATGMFTTDYINKTAAFSTYRAMDWLNTNFNFAGTTINPTSTWSQRTNPNSGSRAGTNQGMAYEDLIALANTTRKNIWINIPILATDDYVCRLARLLAFGEQSIGDNAACSPTATPGTATVTPINSTSTIYIEEANETWNYIFPAVTALNYWSTNGACTGFTSHCTEPPTGTTAPSAMLAAATATSKWATIEPKLGIYEASSIAGLFLSFRNSTIFKEVFSQLGRASQVKIVLGQQGGCQCNDTGGLTWLNTSANYEALGMSGALASWAYALADAPYFDSSATSTVDTLFADLTTQMESGGSMQTLFQYDVNTAASYGLQAVMYEGGQSLVANDTTDLAAQSDPRMATIYKSYYALWFAAGGGLANHFTLEGAWTNSSDGGIGFWGALPGQQYSCSQKYAALLQLSGVTPCTPNQGAMNVPQAPSFIMLALP